MAAPSKTVSTTQAIRAGYILTARATKKLVADFQRSKLIMFRYPLIAKNM
jgi:hypothetical protein